MLTLLRERGTRQLNMRVVAMLLAGLGALALAGTVRAGSPGEDPAAGQTCVVCHATPGLTLRLANGETLPATIDPQAFATSAHGSVLQCTACHPDTTAYPHPALDVLRPSGRDLPFLIRTYTECGSCHAAEYAEYVGSVHAQALTAGKSDSAICSDCHGAHTIALAKPEDVGLALGPAVYNCAPCHKDEYEQYKASVHGKELLENGNPDVPSCVDCHGAHNLHPAKDSQSFRSQSYALCVSCHGNASLMAKYGLSTKILSTYVADFHGTSAQLFPVKAGEAPEQALCYDCHGAHDIQSTASAQGLRVQQNLLTACQKCHPEAGANFPAAWLGHTEPTPQNAALVFWIRGIYNVLVIGTVLLLVGHISLDLGRVLLNTLNRRNHSHD